MKFPKFIKSQQTSTKKKFCSGDQLLLTESTYSVMTNNNKFFTPQKRVAYIINDYKYINDKTYNLQTPKPVAMPTTTTTETTSTPFASKLDSSIADLFQFKTPMNASTKHVNFIDSVGSPRYAKTSAKRLQRNRLQHVKSKPSNYVLRSAVLQSRLNRADCCDSFVTPIKATINEESMIMMNTSTNSIKSTDKDRATLKTTTVINNQQVEQKENQQQQLTENKQRFSLSKLTRLVSQSALKVLTPLSNNNNTNSNKKDRRSYGSNCSSLSSISFQTDDANDTVEDDLEEQEQPKQQIQVNLVKLIDRASSPIKRKVPCMGITSVMLKQRKLRNESTRNYQPDLQLIHKPVIFNSNDLKTKQYSSTNIYDKLDRAALVNSTKSTVTPRKSTPTYLRHQTTCRITVFNGNHNKVIAAKKHYSSSKLNESVQYDQIIF